MLSNGADGKVKMWAVGWGITGGADVSDHLISFDGVSVMQVVCVMVEVSIVVDKFVRRIQLINCQSTGSTGEEPTYGAGFNSVNWCISWY